ncbi:hypothetical protein [Hymenobacter daeguensis]
MNWQDTGNILSALGVFALVVGVLLRFQAGRWLLVALLLILTVISLLSGDFADPPDSNDPIKASNYWLLGGSLSLLLGLALRTFASKTI